MGYTNYFEFKNIKDADKKQIFNDLVNFVAKLEKYKKKYEFDMEIDEDHIAIGGQYEPLFIDKTLHGWKFCKTYQADYDIIIKVVFLKLKDMLGDKFSHSNDCGDDRLWKKADKIWKKINEE